MATKTNQTNKDKETNKKSFFNCCGCGDKETNKEAYVDIKDKQPDHSHIIDTTYKIRSTPAYVRPQSVQPVRNYSRVKPKVMFTYTSPTP